MSYAYEYEDDIGSEEYWAQIDAEYLEDAVDEEDREERLELIQLRTRDRMKMKDRMERGCGCGRCLFCYGMSEGDFR